MRTTIGFLLLALTLMLLPAPPASAGASDGPRKCAENLDPGMSKSYSIAFDAGKSAQAYVLLPALDVDTNIGIAVWDASGKYLGGAGGGGLVVSFAWVPDSNDVYTVKITNICKEKPVAVTFLTN